MRRLVLLSRDSDLEGLEFTDALDCLDDGGTCWLAARDARRAEDSLRNRNGYLGTVRRRDLPLYSQLRLSTLYDQRHRSRDLTSDYQGSRKRAEGGKDVARRSGRALVRGGRALALLRSRIRADSMKSVPLHKGLLRAIEGARPDVAVLPFSGPDDLISDAIRCCKALRVPSLMLYVRHEAPRGDLLDPQPLEEAVAALPPTRVAVWGEAGRDRLCTTLGLEDQRIRLLGAPSLDTLFDDLANVGSEDVVTFIHSGKDRGSNDSLVSAVQAAADELESGFHVVELEPDASRAERVDFIARSAVVVSRKPACVVESAIANRPHILLAFNGKERSYKRLQGIELLQGVEACKQPEDIAWALARILKWREAPPNSLRDDVRYWVYHDERSYGERLVALADELASESYPRPAAVTA